MQEGKRTSEEVSSRFSPWRDAADYPLLAAGMLSAVMLLAADRSKAALFNESGKALSTFSVHIVTDTLLLFGFAIWGATLAVLAWDERNQAAIKKWVAEPFIGLGYHTCPYAAGVMFVVFVSAMSNGVLDKGAGLTFLFLCVLTMFFSYTKSIVTSVRKDGSFPLWAKWAAGALSLVLIGAVFIELLRK